VGKGIINFWTSFSKVVLIFHFKTEEGSHCLKSEWFWSNMACSAVCETFGTTGRAPVIFSSSTPSLH